MSLSSFPHISGRDDEELVEAVSVLGQHGFQTRRSESKAEGGETQIDDARVRLAMAKDELPKCQRRLNSDPLWRMSPTES